MKNQKGINNPNYKDGYTIIQHYCIDCGTEITCQAIRCKSCAHKGIKHPEQSKLMIGSANPQFGKKGKLAPNFKHGETLKKHFCECGNEICYYNFTNGTGRCRSCATKEQMKDPKSTPNWQGGITSLYERIRNLDESINWRNKVFKRDNYTCQDCGDNTGHNLNAHHEKQFAQLLSEFLQEYNQFSPIEDKEILVRLAITWKPFWDITNGKTLCKKCHLTIEPRHIKKASIGRVE